MVVAVEVEVQAGVGFWRNQKETLVCLCHQTSPCSRSVMDALKAEIATKRKAIQDDTVRPKKYMKKGELDRIREEEERKIKEAQQKVVEEEEAAKKKLQVKETRVSIEPFSSAK